MLCKCRQYASKQNVATTDSAKTRNLGIIAHIDAGKTTTTERMLFYSGFIPRIGGIPKSTELESRADATDVDDGNTVMDYLPAERERGITIQSAAITFPWRDHNLNLIDTPGHADFTFEVERALRVLDGAVTILDAVAGVEAQTEKVWRQANSRQIPRMIFVNKMDRVGAGFGRTVREVVNKLNCRPIVLQLPMFQSGLDGGDFIGLVDLLEQKCLVWPAGTDGKSVEVTDLEHYDNPALVGEAGRARAAMIETLSELDESVVDAYLEHEHSGAIPVQILKDSIRRLCLNGTLVPVFVGAAFRNIGVQPLLDGIMDYLPGPSDRPAAQIVEDGSPSTLKQDFGMCALAFKVIVDQQRGPMVFVRVYSGTITKGSVLYNNTAEVKERAMKVLQMYADEAREIDSIGAGNIAVILGLRHTKTGDTLTLAKSNKKAKIALQPIDVPPPVFIATLETSSASESKALELALDNLLREDPSLRVSYEEETGQTLLSGMGELHLEIAGNRLINDFKAKVEIGRLRIGYRETIEQAILCEDLVERVVGSTKSSARVRITLAPLDRDGQDPRQLIDGNRFDILLPGTPSPDFAAGDATFALRNGAAAALSRGLVLGYPLHSVHVTVSVGQYEPDTSLGSLSGAAQSLTQRAINQLGAASMAVLEPIMNVTVSTPEATLGTVMNDLTGTRGGQIMALDESEVVDQPTFEVYAPPDATLDARKASVSASTRAVHARVPLKEMVGYSRALRTLTGGRGNFTMSVDTFEKMNQRGLQQLQQSGGF
ncbi:putative Translation elongation factor G2 [Taphrina deformans PYCC 5710]|uniref:Ribosome-releasing factor 2, mitochondrial n=1 Tax=Taphrina deformans (strain PYCC 5710 / ATCC 11124 / CBS 356.35 / IMI 108563 / JCM 9778 / NBRC 8474) TaxID=1097556 RepID=R4XH58_TAPDE|nr:putative Translation elongation factor G2 [Taphrina deformans PYCC 5710]|eukprot:CCG82721.1 putative Translation elongation factor G2 [Taphrina deformans PYCC 5710]